MATKQRLVPNQLSLNTVENSPANSADIVFEAGPTIPSDEAILALHGVERRTKARELKVKLESLSTRREILRLFGNEATALQAKEAARREMRKLEGGNLGTSEAYTKVHNSFRSSQYSYENIVPALFQAVARLKDIPVLVDRRPKYPHDSRDYLFVETVDSSKTTELEGYVEGFREKYQGLNNNLRDQRADMLDGRIAATQIELEALIGPQPIDG